jgi:hypothetical protein
MITILISVIAAIIVVVIRTYKDRYFPGFDNFTDYLANSFGGLLLGLIIGLIIAFILPMKKYDKHYSYNIENLQDNSGIKGSFFLGCGQIEGKMKYVFYYEENGFFKMEQLEVKDVQIKYSDSKPKVNITEISPSKALINAFALDFDIFDKTYIIEVPKGTIKQNFSLDAQ